MRLVNKEVSSAERQCNRIMTNMMIKVKVKYVDLYSTSMQTPVMCSDMDHTVLPANNTISAFTRKHSPGGATSIYAYRMHEFNLLLIYRPQEDEWQSWPCWLTYSRRFTRGGHPSTACHGTGQGKFAIRSNHCVASPTLTAAEWSP